MTLFHKTISCATRGCFAVITLHPDDEQRLRRTHETFYCPAGHANYFAGKTKTEKRLDELERLVNHLRSERTWDAELRWEMHERLLDVARGLTVCPMGCGWRTHRRLPTREAAGGWAPSEREIARYFDRVWLDLREHLVDEHNATRATVALLEAGEPS